MFKIPDSLQIRKQQILLASGVSVIVIALIAGVIYFFDDTVEDQVKTVSTKSEAIEIESSGKRVNAEKMCRYKIEDDQKKVPEQLQDLTKIVKTPVDRKRTRLNSIQ